MHLKLRALCVCASRSERGSGFVVGMLWFGVHLAFRLFTLILSFPGFARGSRACFQSGGGAGRIACVFSVWRRRGERNLEVIEENFETLCMVILRGLDFLESVLDSRKSCREVERRA